MVASLLGLLLAGCVSASRQEKAVRQRVHATGALLRPENRRPVLPAPATDSPLSTYLRFALLNHPQIEAAYDDWRASVLAIAPARALPDPRFTFQADIASAVTSIMPGLMFDLMSTRRRAAMGREAAAASEVASRRYVTAILDTAAEVKKSWADLTALEEMLRLKREQLALLEEAVRYAHAAHVTIHMTGSLDPMVDLLTMADQTRLEIANLEDQRGALRARFKSALGLARNAPDPGWPVRFTVSSTPLPDDEAFWRAAILANPRLAELQAAVGMTVAQVAVEESSRTPDLAAGFMADLRMNPVLWRSEGTVSLPLWRQKIADTIAAAQARQAAAVARLQGEKLTVAADLARLTYLVRETDRTLAYLDHTALPNLRHSITTAAAAYQTDKIDINTITQAEIQVIALQLERVAALRDREKTMADLSLLVAGQLPAGAPVPDSSDSLNP